MSDVIARLDCDTEIDKQILYNSANYKLYSGIKDGKRNMYLICDENLSKEERESLLKKIKRMHGILNHSYVIALEDGYRQWWMSDLQDG